MRTYLIATIAVLALTLGACGGDDGLETATPATTPDLTIPNSPVAAEDEGTSTSTTSTTDTTATEPSSSGTAAPSTPATPTPSAPATPTPTPDNTGGTAEPTPAAPQEPTGGAEAGGTSDFCAENPGAC